MGNYKQLSIDKEEAASEETASTIQPQYDMQSKYWQCPKCDKTSEALWWDMKNLGGYKEEVRCPECFLTVKVQFRGDLGYLTN